MFKFKKLIKFAIVFFVCLVLLIWIVELYIDYFHADASSIDACLDMGGSWDQALKKCSYKKLSQ